MKKKNKWTKPVQDPIKDAALWLRNDRRNRLKRKCFKVNSCPFLEHEKACEGCVFYRKKIG